MQDLLAVAATQYGCFNRAQAHERGVTDRMLQRRVRSGELECVARSVYRVGGTPRSWPQDVMAACLGGGSLCVASHRTAAALHAFDGHRAGIVEVTVPRPVRYRRPGVIVHQSTDLAPCDVTTVGPIPATTVERTLIDLGAVAGWEHVEHAFDGAERDTTADRLVVAGRHRDIRRQGRNGVGPMAVVLDGRWGPIPHSVLERRFLRLLEQAHVPLPVCQHPVVLPSGRRAFIDAAYVDLFLGFELDGHGTHATRGQRADDNRRANALRDLGWDLRRFTYEQVVHDGRSVVRAVESARARALSRFGDNRRP
jgi:hypothetical protein